MLLHTQSRWPIFAAFVMLIVAICAAPAEAIDISVSGAWIEGGRLVVIGITDPPNTRVRLEGKTADRCPETLEECGTKRIISEAAMEIGPDDPAVGRNGTLAGAADQRKWPGAVGPLGFAEMHLVS